MKSPVAVFFYEWLNIMDEAYEALSKEDFRKLEDKILKEITFFRKKK